MISSRSTDARAPGSAGVDAGAASRAAPAGGEVSLEASYAYCSRLTRLEARNFYHTFRFLTPERRRSIHAVYTFSRRLDDIVDGDGDGDAGDAAAPASREPDAIRARLEEMRRLLDPRVATSDPLAPALRHTIGRYGIPLEHFDELIAGMAMDIEETEYRTFEDLRLYCYRAASTIGLICIEIFGHDEDPGGEVRRAAIDLGLAMQLTNILRDVREDLERGRIYLPADERDEMGVTRDMLERGEATGAFRALMRRQVERARGYFRSAEALFPRIDPASRHCPVLLARFYSAILDQIERRGFDVLSRRPRLSRLRKLRLALGLWVETRLGG